MSRTDEDIKKGYYGIGIFHGKCEENIGTLWRSAFILDADFIFTVGKRYRAQCTDTPKTPRHIPLFHFDTWEDFMHHIPYDCPVCAVELDERAVSLDEYKHPERCIYLLGAEDHGIPPEVLNRCRDVVQIPGKVCYNVAVAGSIVMYDRQAKARKETDAKDA